MPKLLRTVVGLASALALLTAACADGAGSAADGASPTAGGPDSAAGAGAGLTVVATVFPLAWLAEELAPGAAVTLLGSRGQDPHDLELSPADRALLEQADVVVSMGPLGFQPQVEAAIAGAATGEVVSVSEVAGRARLLTLDEHRDADGQADDDHDNTQSDPAPRPGPENGAEDGLDPHVWFDPAVMADVAEAVGDALAAADPGRAEAYAEAAAAGHDELRALDAEIDALLADCAFDTAIVSHEAYAYLLAPRGLDQEGISGAGGHGEASPQRLAELTERIRAEGIPAVLAEPFEGRADAEALAAETDVAVLEIDPLELPPEEEAARGYPALLRAQAEAFATALECGDRREAAR